MRFQRSHVGSYRLSFVKETQEIFFSDGKVNSSKGLLAMDDNSITQSHRARRGKSQQKYFLI
jgi:hypothetical protein